MRERARSRSGCGSSATGWARFASSSAPRATRACSTLTLGSFDPELKIAFDFRHDSWEGVESDLPPNAVRVNDLESAARFRYLRLREPPYDEQALSEWADRIRPLLADGVEVYCYFKHEEQPEAPRDAERLLELLAG